MSGNLQHKGRPDEPGETGFDIVARQAVPRSASAAVEVPTEKARRRAAWWFLRLPYDRRFHPAVVRGHLSIWQAMERGRRVEYALNIAARYGLSLRRAILVADNRLTIARALGLTGAVPYELAPTLEPEHDRSGYKLAVLAAALLLGILCIAPTWLERKASARPIDPASHATAIQRRPRPPAPSIQVAASVRVDAQGRPTEVIAHTPVAVVEAYCRLLGPAAKPGGVVALGRGWLGSVRRDGRLATIEIKRDRTSGMWRVGDGRAPIAETALAGVPARG